MPGVGIALVDVFLRDAVERGEDHVRNKRQRRERVGGGAGTTEANAGVITLAYEASSPYFLIATAFCFSAASTAARSNRSVFK